LPNVVFRIAGYFRGSLRRYVSLPVEKDFFHTDSIADTRGGQVRNTQVKRELGLTRIDRRGAL
jgi:hypothetical protein